MGTFWYLAALLVIFNAVHSHGIRHRVVANRENLGSRKVVEEQDVHVRQALSAAWTEWKVYKSCSVTCGTGIVESTRNCSTGTLSDCVNLGGTWWKIDKCFAGECIDIQAGWSEWTSKTSCSASCGQRGYLEEVRNCSTGHKSDCEALGGRYWKVASCDNGPCTAVWLEWGASSTCSKSCGVGVVVRYRNCSTGNDIDCTIIANEKTYELSVCNAGSCIEASTAATTVTTTTQRIAGTWSEWSGILQCSVTCDSGFGERLRNCSTGVQSDCDGRYWEVAACNPRACLIDGVWGDWEVWSGCTVSCGGGSSSRSRTCTYPDPDAKGVACSGNADQLQSCNANSCPVDGTWGNWENWSKCSQTCDEGQQTRSRICMFTNDSPRGADCAGQSMDTQICNEAVCESDGAWAPWSSWSKCTATCGDGVKFKARTCLFDQAKPRGNDCVGSNIDKTTCKNGFCSVDGAWTSWSFWSQCTVTCGGGYRSRARVCAFDLVAPHGASCTGDKKEIDNCAQSECPVDGIWGGWSAWQRCSVTCGGGTQVKTRTCLYRGHTATTPHGQPCDGEGHLSQICNTKSCAVDGRWSEWSSYGPCNADCGGGFRFKARLCIFDDKAPKGRDCDGNVNYVEQCNAQLCPVDGQLTAWQQWTHCSATCDGGTRSRKRECSFPLNVPHGADCTGNLSETGQCNASPCPTTTTTTTEAPVPGHWSDWSAWNDCSLTCESGTHSRNRTCLYPDLSLHGEKCPGDKNQTASCNTQHCPVDGVWSSWSVYSRCSASCANGTHIRTRTCNFDPRYDRGDNCTGSSEHKGYCWAGYCPVDGVWTDWNAWQACSVTCGGGTQQRGRSCYHPTARPIGENCTGPTTESQSCSTDYCPVDGVLSVWTAWTACPVTCGGSLQIRNRTCGFQTGRPKGNDCLGDLDQKKTCKDNLCPIDGVWSDWATWSGCSQTCGTGSQSRNRQCHYDKDAPHGQKCGGARKENQQCNTEICPVDGHWTDWTPWSKCSVSCENGTRVRDRLCAFIDDAPHGDNCTGDGLESEMCNDGPCPVDGIWSNWASWNACTVVCGTGSKSRTRTCDFPADPIPHGNNCTGSDSDTEECNTNLCPIDGHFDSWVSWGTCSVTCGGGIQSRARNCLFDPVAPHGLDCSGDFNETQNCNTNLCPVDGVWSEWSNYTECSTTCGGGTRIRKRKCDFRPEAAPHGLNCTGPDSETDTCSPDLCPVDGTLSQWSSWSVCSLSCANGTQTRNRSCDFDPVAPKGSDCVGDLFATQSCNEERCPVNGHWSEWSNYTDCTVTCAGGTQTRNRTCVFDPDAPHGAECFGNVTNIQDCNTQPCPVDGVWGSWNAWYSCDVTCGGGNRARDRDCYYPPDTPHGNDCVTGTSHDIEACNDNPCPVDGTWTEWAAWTKCSKTCGGGIQFHSRKCQFPRSVPHGNNCTGSESGQNTCGDSLCPVDGVWSDWEAWGTCSVTCGGGDRSRMRNCTYNINPDNPEPMGDPCPGNDTDIGTCGADVCPVDGKWSQWSDFSPCTKSCGNGTSTRNRNCEFLPLGSPHGNDCVGESVDVISCNETECPQDAVWEAWSTWTACSVTCDGGNQTRDRQCTWPSNVHGDNCTGDSEEMQDCNTNLCPMDGRWSFWSEWSACSETCDLGHSYRSRNCTFDPVYPKGATCPGKTDETQFCKLTACEVDGIWLDWTGWSSCSATCGEGNVTRSRRCEFTPHDAPHGKDCEGDSLEYQPCDNVTDCPVDGQWGSWTAWSDCSTTCGNGDRHRSRVCEFDPTKPRGNDCPHGNTNETEACNPGLCPVDGSWLNWSGWATCSVTCGGGVQQRNRTCFFQPGVPQGDTCQEQSVEQQSCNNNTCEVDGVFADWSQWSTCSTTCGSGSKSRSRTCTFDPPDAPKGNNCTGKWDDVQTCDPGQCKVDGTWTEWATWTQCTVTCGGGTQGRIRDCEFRPHVPQGEFCIGAGTEQRTCSNDTCSVDGKFTDWGPWSTCSVSCGDGDQTRSRTCAYDPPDAPKGQNCTGAYSDTKSCHVATCKVDGSWTAWGAWSPCTVTCGGGTQGRIRDCEFPPHVPQGEFCTGAGTEQKTCSDNTCPTPAPQPRMCQVCTGPPIICETEYELQQCPMDQQYCINTVDNQEDATRFIERKCGTKSECRTGWFETYSSNDKCTSFDEQYIYANQFYCEYCCDTDGCNTKISMDNKWSP